MGKLGTAMDIIEFLRGNPAEREAKRFELYGELLGFGLMPELALKRADEALEYYRNQTDAIEVIRRTEDWDAADGGG